MKKYIDAQKLKDAMNIKDDTNGRFDIMTALQCVDNAPTADVVEVVRCKNCKYAIEGDAVFGITDYYCRKHGIHCLSATDFCSYGEKDEDEV